MISKYFIILKKELKFDRRNKVSYIVALLSMFLFIGRPCSAQERNYLDYHQQSVLIEGHLLGGSDDSTILSQFKNLFDEYKPFAREAFVALQIACRQKDENVLEYFFRKAFLSGISKAHCQLFALTRTEWTSEHGFNLTALYDSCRAYYLSLLDLKLRAQIYKNQRKDDSVKYHLKHPVTLEEKEQFLDKKNVLRKKYFGGFVKVTEDNILFVMDVSKKLGYVPFERTIGILDNSIEQDTQIRKTAGNVQFYPLILQAFMHHGYGFFNLKKELIKSLKMGELHPRCYAFIYDYAVNYYRDVWYMSAASNFGQYTNLKITDSLEDYPNQYRIVQLETWDKLKSESFIDACRRQIGICSRSQDRQAIDYEKRTGIKLRFGFFEY